VLRRAELWKGSTSRWPCWPGMDARSPQLPWMVLTLARIQALLSRGILTARRLLLPRELTGWMHSSLKDISLDESASAGIRRRTTCA
jgi:hypothetical protein